MLKFVLSIVVVTAVLMGLGGCGENKTTYIYTDEPVVERAAVTRTTTTVYESDGGVVIE